MKSLMHKIAAILIAMSLIPLVIGLYGTLTIQTAEKALNSNDKALRTLSGLLTSTSNSLAENTQFQENANSAISQIVDAQDKTYAVLKDMGDTMLPRTMAISKMRFALADAAAAERALLLALNMRHLNERELTTTRDNQFRNIEAAMKSMDDAKSLYLSLLKEGEDKSSWLALEESLASWKENHKEFMQEIASLEGLVGDMIRGGPLFASASRKAYDTVFVRGKSAREACERGIEALNQLIASNAEAEVAEAMELQNRSRTLALDLNSKSESAAENNSLLRKKIEETKITAGVASENAADALAGTSNRFWYLVFGYAFGVVAAAVLGFWVASRISRPVRLMATQMSRIAQGDLTEDVPQADRTRGDEIGQLAQAMQDMITSNREEIQMANAMAEGNYTRLIPIRSEFDQLGRALGTMLTTTNETLSRVSSAVERVGTGAAAVSSASQSLSRGALTSASALEEISQAVNLVDHQAKDNAAHAQKANDLATASRDAAQRGYNAVSELVKSMGEIQQAGNKIASVAKLIDDIAFQTNLLALNAAVEAARAGRQGRGFSVVADEVRNLSGRSAKAAKETSNMVATMVERMDFGVQLAARTDHEFREIVDATILVAQIFSDITDASNAQSASVAHIAKGLGQIDAVIQDNTNNAGQTASSAQELLHQADDLRHMVSQFQLTSRPDVDIFGDAIAKKYLLSTSEPSFPIIK